ncbi:hypothetical protein P879_09520 [Paragonimus westermani]|uniref:Nuclear receptor domain-containing protein n=1 Tax=Paragonimus westermani TaxID=34504 RepID=A0A8T0CYB0_9TREM|nr:hypothetical protein P879_09520 [Paragonimus westermani]
MDRGSHKFHMMDPSQNLRPSKSVFPSAQCFSMRMDSVQLPHALSIHSDRPDSSTSHLPVSCGSADTFENTRTFFQSSPDASFGGYQCAGNYSEYSQNSKVDNMLAGVVRTRRRKAGISDEERVCIVCGEPASGYNFDRLTCESCKAFFRRNALKPKDKIKACSRGGGCVIEGNQRKHCPSCRLEKCFAVGMKRELILPPEKLEQRAKPRRRKQNSPQDSSCSPQHLLTAPSSVGSGNTSLHAPYLSSPLSTGSQQQQHQQSQLISAAMAMQRPTSLNFSTYSTSQLNDSTLNSSALPAATSVDPSTALAYRHRIGPNSQAFSVSNEAVMKPPHGIQPTSSYPGLISLQTFLTRPLSRLAPCRRSQGRTLCRHPRCRRFEWQRVRHNTHNVALSTNHHQHAIPAKDPEPDSRMLNCLRDCVQRIREPFTPEEQLETEVAVTLEQEYNRMDACIRRIIRVVKLLPYFSEIGKPAQLSLLRTNIYGLIVLYSSFFFERGIGKLRYPVLKPDGQLTTVTVSMLDEVVTSNTSGTNELAGEQSAEPLPGSKLSYTHSLNPNPYYRPDHKYTTELREEFELYKANTLAAFDHLDQLIGSDDTLRVCVLAIKLFTDDACSVDEAHSAVSSARQAYLFFLWAYLRWRSGPKRLRWATELYARLLIAFIDLRTLEIRMTEFAKLLSLDGLSPLMREVCSQRTTMLGSTRA